MAQALSLAIAPITANKMLRVRSFSTSLSEILAAYEDLTGAEWKIMEGDLNAETAAAKQIVYLGDGRQMVRLLLGAALDTRTKNDVTVLG